MGKNTSFSLSEHFERFIENMISQGRYQDASEVIRAGLRLLEEEEIKISAIDMALQKGEDSGFITDFDREKHLESLKASKGLNR